MWDPFFPIRNNEKCLWYGIYIIIIILYEHFIWAEGRQNGFFPRHSRFCGNNGIKAFMAT